MAPSGRKMYLLNVAFTIAGYPLGDLWLSPRRAAQPALSVTRPMGWQRYINLLLAPSSSTWRCQSSFITCALALYAVDQVIKPDRFRFEEGFRVARRRPRPDVGRTACRLCELQDV